MNTVSISIPFEYIINGWFEQNFIKLEPLFYRRLSDHSVYKLDFDLNLEYYRFIKC